MAFFGNDVAITNHIVNMNNCCNPRVNLMNQGIYNSNVYRNCTSNVLLDNDALVGYRVSSHPVGTGQFVPTIPPAVSAFAPDLGYAVAANIGFNGSLATRPYIHTGSTFAKPAALIADRAFNGNCGLRARYQAHDLRAFRAANATPGLVAGHFINNGVVNNYCSDICAGSYYGGPYYPLSERAPGIYNHGIPYICY